MDKKDGNDKKPQPPSSEETFLDRVFDEPSPPAPALITQEALMEDLPFADNPGEMIRTFLQQNHLGDALQVYVEGLSEGKFAHRKQSADKILELALGDKAAPSGVNINFSFGGKFNERPEVEVGENIVTGEEERFKK